MTCSGCEEHLKHAVNQFPGIVEVNADYQSGTASIQYDHIRSDKGIIIHCKRPGSSITLNQPGKVLIATVIKLNMHTLEVNGAWKYSG